MSAKLKAKGLSNINERELRRYKLFYHIYPQLGTVFQKTVIWGMVYPKLTNLSIRGTLFPELITGDSKVMAEKIIKNLSFSHISELINIDDPLKRNFYEIEAIKGQWSVKELSRQINTLYFERTGLSANPG